LRVVRGQVEVATTAGTIDSVWLEPEAPEACVEAVRAVREADWVVLGPGSWFTSVIPHLLVPALREALVQTDARVVVVLNLDEQAGETGGFAPEDHLAVLLQYAPDLKMHTVLADRGRVGDDPSGLERVVAGYGATLAVEDVAADDGSPRHDPAKLASAYARILAQG
jgi:uncharacterized cofD-like protein